MERCTECGGRGYVREPKWKKDGTLSRKAARVVCPHCQGQKRFPEGFEDAWRERQECPALH